ncbi:phosphotransferase enzyme family protein [Colletotrichum sp. SAR 10_96]|nr:phosphotransferase enzyme family protein [Colletotrichum sp. SAR 10_96]
MAQQVVTPSLRIGYDSLVYSEGADRFKEWKSSIVDGIMISRLEVFIAEKMGRVSAEFVEEAEGSYNMMFRFRIPGTNDVAFRFPKPGHTPPVLAAEKLANEVAWMKYFRANTNIPIPSVHYLSLEPSDSSSPLELPCVLMDFVEGHNLREFLATLEKPGKSKSDDAMRLAVYEQLAKFYLQLHRLHFDKIGSIVEDRVSGRWEVTQRPLTMDMHQLLLGVHEYQTSGWPTKPLQRSIDYFGFVADQHRNQLWGLRNLNSVYGEDQNIDLDKAAEVARLRFRAREGFQQLIPLLCDEKDDEGPFLPFNPDLDSRNMIVDPDTGCIKGVFDFEFTNAMPAQFARDPPLWLSRVLPGACLDRGYFPWFLETYQPYLDQFLAAMRKVEQLGWFEDAQPALSVAMRESWETKRCWFNYAAHHADQVDAIYWAVLRNSHSGSANRLGLSTAVESGMEKYVEHTKSQIVAFEREWQDVVSKGP